MSKERILYGERIIDVFFDNEEAPMIVLSTYADEGSDIYTAVKEMTTTAFNLIVVSKIDWNNDLSPWLFGPIAKGDPGYKGGADIFLHWLVNELLPFLFSKYGLRPESKALMGYSLAGLFSLYAGYRTDYFDSLISVSGSLWFPKFLEFVNANELSTSVRSIYMSLGDKEALAKNQYMKAVGENTLAIYDQFKRENRHVEFAWNPGGHFFEVTNRQAKAIAFYLAHLQQN